MCRLQKSCEVVIGKFLIASLAGTSLILAAEGSHALTVSVGGTNYNLTTVTDDFNTIETTLQSQPFWGNVTLARSLAVAAWDGGANSSDPFFTPLPNPGNDGPYFAYGAGTGVGSPAVVSFARDPGIPFGQVGLFSDRTWALAEEVEIPAPLPLFGAAAAFGYSRKLRKRIKDSKVFVAKA